MKAKFTSGTAIFLTILMLLMSFGTAAAEGTEIEGLKYLYSMEKKYATEFSVDYYEDGYKLLSISDGLQYLIIPEGKEAPEGLNPQIVRLFQPLDRVYLAATASMALINALDCLDCVRLSGTRTEGWYIEEAAQAMEAGEILFAGKYSEPDFELMIHEQCNLAIESTMILHTPKVKEMIEMLGIPVLIERSSYETHPLGRTEWIKVFGALFNREAEAEAFFDEQAKVMDALENFENTGKTAAFFYVSSDGKAVVRNSNDYVPKMIEIAGGKYVFDEIGDQESKRSSVSITMEEFYAKAVQADYLIYNSSIDDALTTMDELLAKSPLFADFKAVKAGNVWCTGKYLFQATDIVGNLIVDLNKMFMDDEEGMTFLYRIQ